MTSSPTPREPLKIAFRVDGSSRIGGGHVMRCLTLADRLREVGGGSTFICRLLAGAPIDRIRSGGHAVEALPAPSGDAPTEATSPPHANWLEVAWRRDADETAERLRAMGGVDWLVIDHYALDARWAARMTGLARRILVLDDLDDRDLSGDVLLNQSFVDRTPMRPGPVKQLIGPQYVLLRPEFAALRAGALERRGHATDAPTRVLVSTGLMDVGGAALKSVRALLDLPIRIDVAVGSQAQSAEALKAIVAPNLHVHLDCREVGVLMRDADLGVGAAGATSWERLAMGLPSLVFVLAENQKEIAAELAARGVCRSLGAIEAVREEDIRRGVLELLGDWATLDAMSRKAAALCDGRGAERVVAIMRDQLAAPSAAVS